MYIPSGTHWQLKTCLQVKMQNLQLRICRKLVVVKIILLVSKCYRWHVVYGTGAVALVVACCNFNIVLGDVEVPLLFGDPIEFHIGVGDPR